MGRAKQKGVFDHAQNAQIRIHTSYEHSLGSHVGKPSSAYGWSSGFSPGSPVFAHL